MFDYVILDSSCMRTVRKGTSEQNVLIINFTPCSDETHGDGVVFFGGLDPGVRAHGRTAEEEDQ